MPSQIAAKKQSEDEVYRHTFKTNMKAFQASGGSFEKHRATFSLSNKHVGRNPKLASPSARYAKGRKPLGKNPVVTQYPSEIPVEDATGTPWRSPVKANDAPHPTLNHSSPPTPIQKIHLLSSLKAGRDAPEIIPSPAREAREGSEGGQSQNTGRARPNPCYFAVDTGQGGCDRLPGEPKTHKSYGRGRCERDASFGELCVSCSLSYCECFGIMVRLHTKISVHLATPIQPIGHVGTADYGKCIHTDPCVHTVGICSLFFECRSL